LSASADISARKQAEEQTRQHREELAHLSCVAVIGEIAGSPVHGIIQPLTGRVNKASASRRFIAKGSAGLPKFDTLCEAIIAAGHRAGAIKREGMGMGLAIARPIVPSQGGELAAANAEGSGAKVYFWLPVSAKNQGGGRAMRQSKAGQR
jgi:C4-dicarboxylate-specific signal transduction histidine kinase